MTKMKKGKAASRIIARPRHARRSRGGAVFDQHFFEEILPRTVGACPTPGDTKPVVTIWLADGGQLDCCGVVAFEERYCVLAAYEGTGNDGIPRTADDVGFEAIPYDLVLRCTVRAAPRPTRLGFGEAIATKD